MGRVGFVLASALVFAACDSVFGLQDLHTPAPDAFLMYDEDGDGIDNTLDNCPTIYNPDQLDDGDHDGIGDVCDPHRTTPGDHLVFADYFDGTSYTWTPDSGAHWRSTESALDSTAAPDATNALLSRIEMLSAPTIAIGFTVLDYGTDSSANNAVEITIAYPSNSGTCRIIGMAPGDPFDEAATDVEKTDLMSTNLAQPIMVNEVVTMTLTREPSSTKNGRCLVNNTTTPMFHGAQTTFTDVNASIAVRNMKVSLRYALVYDVP
ncbi:MAG: thrombospondin [Myxococcales bacterium]|nr:thrombospondin [Myxococcales bacterium]